MAIDYTYYGTLSDAADYFSHRLHSKPWDNSTDIRRAKALYGATQIIDTLNYKGKKAAVHALDANATQEEIRAAEASQPREFPRGSDVDVPDAILIAAYEIAFELLSGKDVNKELEKLAISSQGYSAVRTTYNRSQTPIEHLINGVLSATAWRHLKPFLRDGDLIRVDRSN